MVIGERTLVGFSVFAAGGVSESDVACDFRDDDDGG